MATVTIDPTVPPNSENPQNGAFRIREVTGWLLDVLGLNSAVPNTITIPATPQFDTTTGNILVRALPGAIGLTGLTGGGTSFLVTAPLVYMTDPNAGNVITQSGAFGATCTIVGPQAGTQLNGRDQAAAFSASTFFHLYAIGGNGQTPGLIASLTPPYAGPTFPPNYNSFAYLATLRTDASANVAAMYLAGNTVYYQSSQQILFSGTATAATAIDLSAQVPAIAQSIQTYFHSTCSAISGNPVIEIGLTSATTTSALSFYEIRPAAISTSGGDGVSGWTQLPNLGQQIFYKWTLNGSSGQALDLEILSYTVPNGSS